MGKRKLGPLDTKMKVLREFDVVNAKNEKDIKLMLEMALRDHPNEDPDMVLDRAAKPLIFERLHR